MNDKLGISIRVFLAEGTPDGLWIVEKSNWSGVGYVFARSDLKKVGDRAHLSEPGVYVLEGPSDDDAFDRRIYVGESDDCWKRLKNHLGSDDKDFWTRTVVFASKDDNLNKAHIRYLEARLIQLANAAKRVSVANGTAPPLPSLSEADRADAEGFLREMLLILPILRIDAFESVSASAPSQVGEYPDLRLSGKGADGRGQDRPEGFVVFAGSIARGDEVPSIHPWGSQLRKALVESGVLVPGEDGGFVFAEDRVFESPSRAAMVLLGRSANGRIEWKTEDGVTLKELQASQVAG